MKLSTKPSYVQKFILLLETNYTFRTWPKDTANACCISQEKLNPKPTQ
jgi:hypothetical protein